MSLKYKLGLHKAQNFVDDRILPIFCGILGFFKRKGALPQSPKQILFIRFSGLGDAIQSLPTIKRLHERYPHAKITVLCVPRNKEAFQRQKFIHEVKIMGRGSLLFTMPLYCITHFRSFDLCIDAEQGFKLAAMLSFFLSKRAIGFSYREGIWLYDVSVRADPAEHGVPRLARLLRPLSVKFTPKELVPLNASEEYRRLIDGRFKVLGINPKSDLLVGIHAFAAPTSAWRAWPKERVVELIERLRMGGCKIALTGLSSDSTTAKEVLGSLIDPTNVYDFSDLPSDALFYLVKNYSLMVSIDSGPMHIAAAQGVPTIGLFGPKGPSVSGPYPPKKFICFHKAPKGHHHKSDSEAWKHGCAADYIRQISVNDVYNAARRKLGFKIRKQKFCAGQYLIRVC